MNTKRIGNEIRNIRKEKGLSQAEFGELIDGANKSLVSRWENGLILPNNNRQKLIAELANVDVSEFFEKNNNPFSVKPTYIEYHLLHFEGLILQATKNQSNEYGIPYSNLVKESDVQEMKYELFKKLISLLKIIDDGYGPDEFIEDDQKFMNEYITSAMDEIIRVKLNSLTQSIPKTDFDVYSIVKQDIIKIERNLRSYYLDTTDSEVVNENLNLDTYHKISSVLKDTIFHLVQSEEFN